MQFTSVKVTPAAQEAYLDKNPQIRQTQPATNNPKAGADADATAATRRKKHISAVGISSTAVYTRIFISAPGTPFYNKSTQGRNALLLYTILFTLTFRSDIVAYLLLPLIPVLLITVVTSDKLRAPC